MPIATNAISIRATFLVCTIGLLIFFTKKAIAKKMVPAIIAKPGKPSTNDNPGHRNAKVLNSSPSTVSKTKYQSAGYCFCDSILDLLVFYCRYEQVHGQYSKEEA